MSVENKKYYQASKHIFLNGFQIFTNTNTNSNLHSQICCCSQIRKIRKHMNGLSILRQAVEFPRRDSRKQVWDGSSNMWERLVASERVFKISEMQFRWAQILDTSEGPELPLAWRLLFLLCLTNSSRLYIMSVI